MWTEYQKELPPMDEIVLAYDSISEVKSIGQCFIDDEEIHFEWVFMSEMEMDSEPTHWMLFPDPPKDL